MAADNARALQHLAGPQDNPLLLSQEAKSSEPPKVTVACTVQLVRTESDSELNSSGVPLWPQQDTEVLLLIHMVHRDF